MIRQQLKPAFPGRDKVIGATTISNKKKILKKVRLWNPIPPFTVSEPSFEESVENYKGNRAFL
jgi:ATP-dependent Clp protease ATP-binding subunit ClpA